MRLLLIFITLLGLQGCGKTQHPPTMISSTHTIGSSTPKLDSIKATEALSSSQAKPFVEASPSLIDVPGAPLSSRHIAIDPRIGQRFIVGFYGTTPERAKIQLERYIRDYHIGGVILFGRHSVDNITEDEKVRKDSLFPGNISQDKKELENLTGYIQELNTQYSNIPLFIGVDQEGGLISRLRNCGLGPTLSHAELGQEAVSKTTEEASRIAQYLQGLGFNLNFAPVVDLATNPDNPVIVKHKRSFGADPAVVIKRAKAYILAHIQEGISPCIKHFPGHGSTAGDTHEDFTDASQTWTKQEIEPYRELIAEGIVDLIMASHVYNDQIDDTYPASLSQKTLTDLLRQDLGYTGAIITDDIEMKALLKHYSYEQIIALSAKAGVDLFIIGNHDARREGVENSIEALQALYNKGEISEEDVETPYKRILSLKQKLFPEAVKIE